MRLGIDFGTTRTVVAVAEGGRYPLAAFDEGGEYREHVPGMAAIVDGALVVGWEAARAMAAGRATHAIRSVKRVVGALAPDAIVEALGADITALDDASPSPRSRAGITALELATAFLRGLRASLALRSNVAIADGEVLEVVVAVPANAASRQRWLTLEAFRRAGFSPIGLINEPTAAAIEHAHLHLALDAKKRPSPKRYVVVYDLGGGTFDTSAVSLEDRSFDLIASEGLADLGGDDFDALVLDAIGAPHTIANLERAREAKETLRPTTRKLLVDLGDAGDAAGATGDRADPGTRSATIDTATLYAAAQPLIDRTLAQTELLFARLAERGIDPEDPRELGGVYVVGGGAAFPAVARSLRARFGKKLQLAPQPFAATAVGLAVAADPTASVRVREAITRHFGVWREAAGGADKIFDPLLGKNVASPLTIERRYRPTHSVGHLRFVECGALDPDGQPVQDLVPWADVYFPYDPALADHADLSTIPSERRGELARDNLIAETYTYATDGTISVTIANLSHAYARSYALGVLR